MAFLDNAGLSYVLTKLKAWVESRGYLTEHQSLAGYAKTADLGDLASLDSITTAKVTDFVAALNGWLSHPVSQINTDLNTITEQGVYYVASSSSTDNFPAGTNGVLFVFCPASGTYVHQWYRRYGTAGSNDHQIYVRAKASGSSIWGEWTKILTGKDSISTSAISDWSSATSNFLTASDLTPVEIPLTDAGYMDFTTLKAWRSGNVVQVYLYFKTPATAPSSWTTIATGLPAPMMQLKTCAATWTASYARPVALSVETDGSIKAIYGKASNNYGITFSYVTAD